MALLSGVAQSKAEVAFSCGGAKAATVLLPDPKSGRDYEIYVSLPAGYEKNASRNYPLLLLADGGRAFPHLSCDIKKRARAGDLGTEPVVIGLSYAKGENLEDSRRRDYTPVSMKATGKAYGGAAAYQQYLTDVVIPYVENHYRIDRGNRMFWGHSYGGLLGAHILFTNPRLFRTYVLGSPSLWFADYAILANEAAYAASNQELNANVLLYVGGLETRRYDAGRRGYTRDMVADMQAFAVRLETRNYHGLTIHSTVLSGKDHLTSVRPGMAWAIVRAFPPIAAGAKSKVAAD